MAGAVGFEPTIPGTKIRCLTSWPRPSVSTVHEVLVHQALGQRQTRFTLPEPTIPSSRNRLRGRIPLLFRRCARQKARHFGHMPPDRRFVGEHDAGEAAPRDLV